MAIQPICSYQYTYGAGIAPNRKIDFYVDENGVHGTFWGKANGKWYQVQTIHEGDMQFEPESTTKKMQRMLEAREKNEPATYLPKQNFTKENLDVLKNLEPEGPYRISITNEIGADNRFERIKRLSFFDPT